MIAFRTSHFVAIAVLFIASVDAREVADSTKPGSDRGITTVAVSGGGVHYFTTAIVHSQEITPTGMIQRSTETVELNGDLNGRILYHPTSVFDFVNGTLVNTGDQVFSGTVAGSDPVMLYDDEFRFDVNFNTGKTVGKVYLSEHIAGPKVRCDLDIVGTGAMTPDGNAIAEYTGTCTFRGQRHSQRQ